MSTILVRDLDESVKIALRNQAKRHGRSMEAEVRTILTNSVTQPNIAAALMQAASAINGIDDLPLPHRDDQARAAEFA